MMTELSLKEAFQYQLEHTQATPREASPYGIIESKGGIEYLRRCKNKGYRLRDVSKEVGCAISTIGLYCRKNNTKWSEL